jgi:hypothetical protein
MKAIRVPLVRVLLAFAVPAQAAIISGGDFQLYKPGSTSVTATLTGGYVPWLSSIPDPTAPTSLTVSGGSANYSDSTTGSTVDLPGWTKTQGGGDLLANGPASSMALNLFAAWGGFPRPIVETTGSLFTVAAGETITISTMVGGPATGPKSGSFFFSLYAGGVEVTPTSVVNQSLPLNDGFQMISRTYNPAALAAFIGQTTKIRFVIPDSNTIGNRIIFDDVTLVTSVPDTTPPTLISFEHDKGSGPIVVNEPVIYTVTFSEPMIASTVDASDFGNTGATAMTVNNVTPTANPAVFLVGVKPTAAGTLQLQIVAGATLTDIEANALVTGSAIPDDSSLVVNNTPPAPTTTVLVSSGSPTTYGQNVTFTATVSPTPTGGTVQFLDGGNNLDSPVTVNTGTGVATYSTAALGVATHGITAAYSGNFQFAASTTAAPFSQEVVPAQLTVRASNAVRTPNTANPDPLAYQITGFKNGENLGTSGVTGTPALSTDAVLASPVGNYTITCALGDLAATNYSFTPVNGTLTIKEIANTFSVNFHVSQDSAYGGGLTTAEQWANVRVDAGIPAGFGDWFTSGWTNVLVPWGGGQQPLQVLTSNQGSTATFNFKDCRNGWTYNGPRTTLLGDGNGNMMDAHVNSTLSADGTSAPNLFDMEMTNIPFAVYDVIFYIGANQPQFGDGTGVIKFNGSERAFTLKPGAFEGTFTEMVDATTQGNYIVFTGVTGSSFTTQTWGTGPTGFNHVGPFGFQIREASSGFATWAATNAPGQTPDQDHDNDGVDNGIEYFMGETGSSFTAMPGLDGTNTVIWPMDPTYVGAYEVQTSTDLGIWTNVEPRPLPSGGNLSYLLPSGLGKQFVRLLVTPAP